MKTAFIRMLNRARRVILGGLLLASALRLLTLLLAVMLAGVLCDALFAFSESVRWGMGLAFLLGAAVFAGYALVTVLSLSRRTAACWIDDRLGSRRRPVLTALELSRAPPAGLESDLGRYLTDQALARGCREGAGLPARRLLPRRRLKRETLRLVLALAAWLVLGAVWTAPLRTHSLRLLLPARDIPPWSRISFSIEPDHPQVVYGDSLEITATLAGPFGEDAVLFDVRDAAHAYRSAGFREATNRFVHRLEHVVQPVRFCVRAGRARSAWHELTVLYQPRIASAKVTLVPPGYAGLPSREFYLGGQPLAGLRGSRVTLDVAANRTIRSGFLLFTRPDGTETRIDGQAPGDTSIRFEWPLEFPATVAIHVQDLLGTPNARTHVFSQELIPDEPPVAALLEPVRYSLATPDSFVSVKAEAEDALGLRSVALVRNLAGYRDRAEPVGLSAGARRTEYASRFDLSRIGVRPGETIELYLEAADTNPDRSGTAMSDISRIDIISNEEYAEILRLRTAVEEFGQRYALITRQLEQLRSALQNLESLENTPRDTPENRGQAVRQVLDAWQALDESYEQIARDFAIYDLEQNLPPVLDQIRSLSEPHAGRLRDLTTPFKDARAVAGQWLQAIHEPAAELERQAEDAALADQLMQVARAAIQFQRLIERQAALVRSLARYEADLRSIPASRLADIAADQADIAADLETWFTQTSALAEALPEDQADLAKDMRMFMKIIRGNKAPEHMRLAETAARNENAPETYRQAREALDALQNAGDLCCKNGNTFAGMCRNPGQGFCVKSGLCSTIQQLCQALLAQLGQGRSGTGIGMGGGGLYGGNPADGYWSFGSSLLEIPLHGPARHAFMNRTGLGRGHGGDGQGRAGSVQATESIDSPATGAVETRTISLDEIPERYREPARIFYRIDEPSPGARPHE